MMTPIEQAAHDLNNGRQRLSLNLEFKQPDDRIMKAVNDLADLEAAYKALQAQSPAKAGGTEQP
jgi:hypothetical protein